MRSQSTVVSSVLISGIIIAIVGMVYVWGTPLVQKSSDKANIDGIRSSMEDINELILDVASTGTMRKYDINVGANDELRVTEKGIFYQTYTSVPIISSAEWAPLNTHELAFERENNLIITDGVKNDATSCVSHTGDIKYKRVNITLETGKREFDVVVFNRGSGYDYACISDDATNIDCANDCQAEGGTINKEGTYLTFLYINSTGYNINVLGREVEKIGTLGESEMGVLMAKAAQVGNKQKVEFWLMFRPLKDPITGNLNRINITCSEGCLALSGRHTIQISRSEQNTYLGEYSTTESIINIKIT